MQFKAIQKNTRQAPRKVRLVANTVKDMPLEQAINQLAAIQRRSTLVVLKTIKQAIANAKNNHGIDFSQLAIKEILVNGGPKYKRFRAVSRGRAHNIEKKTCHVSVTLEQVSSKLKAEDNKGKSVSTKVIKKAINKPKSGKKVADEKSQSALKFDTKLNRKQVAQTSSRMKSAPKRAATVRKSTSK